MVTLTQVTLTCDVCGDAEKVQTRTIGLDGRTYEVDLCPDDSKRLSKAAARYVSKARAGAATAGHGPKARVGAATAGHVGQAGAGADTRRRAGKRNAARPPERRRGAVRPPERGRGAARPQPDSGVLVYGIFPADIEVAAGQPGVGRDPGPLRAVRDGEVAALVSEVHPAGGLGSPDDRRNHREILDASAPEAPVLPLPFGTVLASDEAVAKELLAAHGDEFSTALRELEGRAQFVIRGRYRDAAAAGSRDEDARAVQQAMAGRCVASRVRKPAGPRAGLQVALLVDTEAESEVERVTADLAREWDGRLQLELLGPMAAYDFAPTMTHRPSGPTR
jgi:hypothetical protein